MSFEDKSIQCSDCGATFTFSAGEQEFFATKGFTNEPKRCPQCRQAKRRQSGSGTGSGSGGYGYSRSSRY
jgi:ssDNA-binding Zn-finger/Zn-ribbon topoisomerase 1